MSITLTVNGLERTVDADPDTPLLWVLRDTLGLTGTKYSCGAGQCGACSIHLDGELRQACVTPLASAAGKRVVTIEGLAPAGDHPLQQAWAAEGVSQCGYCQPGQLMAAAALLAATSDPTDADIDRALAAHLCRCGTYLRIRRAIHRAAKGGESR
jgi:aerobic-type carbon monoxide dehydrogenase small subunit (CoxS/CutS family)